LCLGKEARDTVSDHKPNLSMLRRVMPRWGAAAAQAPIQMPTQTPKKVAGNPSDLKNVFEAAEFPQSEALNLVATGLLGGAIAWWFFVREKINDAWPH